MFELLAWVKADCPPLRVARHSPSLWAATCVQHPQTFGKLRKRQQFRTAMSHMFRYPVGSLHQFLTQIRVERHCSWKRDFRRIRLSREHRFAVKHPADLNAVKPAPPTSFYRFHRDNGTQTNARIPFRAASNMPSETRAQSKFRPDSGAPLPHNARPLLQNSC